MNEPLQDDYNPDALPDVHPTPDWPCFLPASPHNTL